MFLKKLNFLFHINLTHLFDKFKAKKKISDEIQKIKASSGDSDKPSLPNRASKIVSEKVSSTKTKLKGLKK